MSIDIPTVIENDIRDYANAAHVTTSEAVIRLIRVGLLASSRPPAETNAILAGLGLFGSPEDTALLNSAVEIAYEERRRPSSLT